METKKMPKALRIILPIAAVLSILAVVIYTAAYSINGNYRDIQIGDVVESSVKIDIYKKEGKQFTVEGSKGKPTVINFWYPTCSGCVSEMPEFNEVATERAGKINFFAFAGVSGKSDWKSHIDSYWSSYVIEYGFDEDDLLYQQCGGNGTFPRTLVCDSQMKVHYIFNGSTSKTQLLEKIDECLPK